VLRESLLGFRPRRAQGTLWAKNGGKSSCGAGGDFEVALGVIEVCQEPHKNAVAQDVKSKAATAGRWGVGVLPWLKMQRTNHNCIFVQSVQGPTDRNRFTP
jgi:hypothetical protein